jgi:acid phosphatase
MHNKTVSYGAMTRTVMATLVITFAASGWVFGQNPTPVAPPAYKPEYKAEEFANRALDANLYMQTSAEYRACCYQAYNLALFRLREQLAQAKSGNFAVVMDLDETAVDNSGFQAMQLRSGLAYDQRLWDAWEEQGFDKLGLIPGAKEFILEARKLNVAVVYISNRKEKFREQTTKGLVRLGIEPKAKTEAEAKKLLKLRTDTSDKTARRQEAEQEHMVLLYIGDNLRDFDDAFRCTIGNGQPSPTPTPCASPNEAEELERAIKARKDTVDKHRTIWGDKWIILPNPAYGEWTVPLGRGRSDYDRLTAPAPANK